MTAHVEYRSFNDKLKTCKPGEEAQAWTEWSRGLQRWLLTLDDLTDAKRLNYLLLLCGERAERAYQARANAGHTIDDAITIITEHFAAQQTPQLARHQLARARQEPAELFVDFVQRLERLAAAGNVCNVNTAVLDAIASGCRSPELRLFVLGHPPPELNAVLRHGRLLEQLEKPSSSTADVLTVQPGPATPETRECGNCGRVHPPRHCPAFGKLCYRCGRNNHLARLCRQGGQHTSAQQTQAPRPFDRQPHGPIHPQQQQQYARAPPRYPQPPRYPHHQQQQQYPQHPPQPYSQYQSSRPTYATQAPEYGLEYTPGFYEPPVYPDSPAYSYSIQPDSGVHFADDGPQAYLGYSTPPTRQPVIDHGQHHTYLMRAKLERTVSSKLTPININGLDLYVLPDTGSDHTILQYTDYQAMHPQPALEPCSQVVFGFIPGAKIPFVGQYLAQLSARGRQVQELVYITTMPNVNSLSCAASEALGLAYLVRTVVPPAQAAHPRAAQQPPTPTPLAPATTRPNPSASSDEPPPLRPELDFPRLFSAEPGLIKGFKVKLTVDPSVQPVQEPHRRVPVHLRQVVESELERLLDVDHIERPPPNEPTPWIAPTMVVKKPDQSGIRLCSDARQVNRAIQRERHPMLTLDDIRYRLNGMLFMSKLDLNKAYNQVELDEESRYLTTFTTHVGLFRYKRLFFGLNSAAETFQNILATILRDIPLQLNQQDDILTFGRNVQEHDQILYRVLRRLDEHGATLCLSKCRFRQTSIVFNGMLFDTRGIAPLPSRVQALQDAAPPRSPSEVRSLIGAINYSAAFIQDAATLLVPLKELVSGNTPWQWTSRHQDVLEKVKEALIGAALGHFSVEWETEVVVDASPTGLGAVLRQHDPADSSQRRVISYKSRTLTGTELRYSQLEREALAIVWGCEKHHLYVFGHRFVVISDNKAVVAIFSNPTSKPTPRIERLLHRMTPYEAEVTFQPGEYNPADYLSRQPLDKHNSNNHLDEEDDDTTDEYTVNIVMPDFSPAVSVARIIKALDDEPKFIELRERIVEGRLADLDSQLAQYASPDAELSISDEGLLLRGHQIIIPPALVDEVISAAHEGHQGIGKTKSLLRTAVWFPRMNERVESAIKACLPCQASQGRLVRPPLTMTDMPPGPWKDLSLDFFSPLPNGAKLLVLIDQYSRYPVTAEVTTEAARFVIPKLEVIFSMFGVPSTIKTDNGPPFNGAPFAAFMSHFHEPPSLGLGPVVRLSKPCSASLGVCNTRRRALPLWQQQQRACVRASLALARSLARCSNHALMA